jgi:transposase
MQPRPWFPAIALSSAEQTIVRRVRRARLFVFLREQRHRIFDAPFQAELAQMYGDAPQGQPPISPALLGLATILQAYCGVSDDEAVEACVMDRRWQLALDCLDCADAPFSKGTLVAFRERLIARDLDRRLIDRTVEVAKETNGFGHQRLRLALDSSALWGAGRVEDTLNLLGHALRKALGLLARRQRREGADGAKAAAGAEPAVLDPSKSLKAALDVDWDDPASRSWALGVVLGALDQVEAAVAQEPTSPAQEAAQAAVGVAQQVAAQDVEAGPDGQPQLRRGVAKDRRISIEDADMRHGRKSASLLVDGFKRHVGRDLDSGLVRAVGLTGANAPEASVTPAIAADLAQQGDPLSELHIDRA